MEDLNFLFRCTLQQDSVTVITPDGSLTPMAGLCFCDRGNRRVVDSKYLHQPKVMEVRSCGRTVRTVGNSRLEIFSVRRKPNIFIARTKIRRTNYFASRKIDDGDFVIAQFRPRRALRRCVAIAIDYHKATILDRQGQGRVLSIEGDFTNPDDLCPIY